MSRNRRDPSVVVIGAGMTGILLVIKLREAGISNITLLEKKGSIGGTWRENTYPGVACDVPAHAYTYSFEPNPDWSSRFAPGDEIREYFTRVFYKYGVDRCTRFSEAVTGCVYEDGQWTVRTSQGNAYRADLLFAATGMLHQPVIPDFPGRDSFAGAQFHSARWDHSVELAGKRIGVVGTGSSGTQLIPELVGLPGTDVSVFQRTPQWIIDLPNSEYSDRDRQRFREKPSRMRRERDRFLFIFEQGTAALASDSIGYRLMHRLMWWNAKRYLKKSVKDPELRAKLTPDYKFGCKRVVMNSTFYPAIQQPNAHLETSGIRQIEAQGIRTEDGRLHALDVIVFATGFDPVAYMRPMEFVGRGGVSIDAAWREKVQAYRSICVPGFPNFFLMLGPHSPIGNYSVISISEIQADYALKLVGQWQRGGLDVIEAKREAMTAWNRRLKEKMRGTVWASGCQSWYLDADGDPLTWPDTWRNWVAAMREPDLKDFVLPEAPSREAGEGDTASAAA